MATGILHADLDAFFASVAQRDDPSLRGRPVAVGPGVVMAASYEARAHGVRGGMPIREALGRCPGLLVVRNQIGSVMAASEAVFAIFRETTPLVEGVGVDEAFLDVRGLARSGGTPEHLATVLRARVRDEVGLPLSVGIARTKVLAKMASVAAKPDGLRVVEPDGEEAFLHPLPVRRLWGVGANLEAVLVDRGIRTIGDLVVVGEPALIALVGGHQGRLLHALATGNDPSRVRPRRERRSFGAQRALGRRRRPFDELEDRLDELVDGLARRLRSAERCAATVTLRLRFDDYRKATRSHTLPRPTDRTDVLVATARTLLGDAAPTIATDGCTLIGAALSGLGPHRPQQLVLPFDGVDRGALDDALDAVRDRFGRHAVARATTLGRERHQPAPMLPDRGDPTD